VSAAAAEHVEAAFGQPVAVVPNGIDVAAWAPRPGRPDDEPGPVRLVSTMRLAPRKRAVPLVELVADAADRVGHDRLRLDVIGSGPAAAAVEAAVRRRGLQDVVRLRGRLTRPEVRDAYDDADVFLAPAELEAFGIAALEARTAGLVVLARTGTGIASFVEDDVDGSLVGSDAAMTEAVVALVEDPARLARMRAHNRRVPPAFDWTDVLAGAEQEYERARRLAPRG
jgi:glycosyltransferase involved in cell wall biosynthesis